MSLSAFLAILGGFGTLAGICFAFAAYKAGLKKDGSTNGTLMSDVRTSRRVQLSLTSFKGNLTMKATL